MTEHIDRPPRAARSGPSLSFALIVGLAVGSLFSALVVPQTQRSEEAVALDAAGPAAAAGQPSQAGSAVEPADGSTGATTPATAGTSTASTGTGSLPAGGSSASTPGGAGSAPSGTAPASGSSGQQPAGAVRPGGGAGSAGGATGSTAPAPAPGAPGPAPVTGDVQGVTADTIRIGVAVPDLGVLTNLGPNYDIGNPQEHFEAILAEWYRTGRAPVHGRDIEFVYRTFDALTPEEQRAACVGFATDDQVFAVIGVSQFYAASDCIAAEYGLPLITSLSHFRSQSNSAGRLLFDLQAEMDRVLVNFVHWAHDNGFLAGKTIGVYHHSGADGVPIAETFIPALESLGYAVEVVVTTDNHTTGSPSDGVAVQRFRAAGVDLAFLFASAINQTNFMQQAEAQLYRPTYLQSDYISSTNDTAASTFPPSQYDGTYAMTQLRFGEKAGGYAESAAAVRCQQRYRDHSGRDVSSDGAPAEWYIMQQGCDEAEATILALEGAGPSLSTDSFATAMESLRDVEMGVHSDVSFFPQPRGGTHDLRTLQWQASCTCYRAVSDFRPFYVEGRP